MKECTNNKLVGMTDSGIDPALRLDGNGRVYGALRLNVLIFKQLKTIIK